METIFVQIAESENKKPKIKVSIVGVGAVGMATAFSIMSQSIANVLVLIDFDENKVDGEVLDLQQCSQFLDTCSVVGGNDYSYTADSDVVLITAGVRQQPGESRLNLTQRNLDIYKGIVPEVVKYSPNCIIVVISNPVDILTGITWKLSGFPRNRVLGSGTIIDSARFRHILGTKLNLAASSVHGYIIGEHGDSSVAVWSKVNFGGLSLSNILPNIPGENSTNDFENVHKQVIDSAYEIIRLKGYTSWAIGLGCAKLCHALVNDRHVILPVSTNVKGLYGIEEDVFLSIPCVVNASGVAAIISMSLSDEEVSKLQASAKTLSETTQNLAW